MRIRSVVIERSDGYKSVAASVLPFYADVGGSLSRTNTSYPSPLLDSPMKGRIVYFKIFAKAEKVSSSSLHKTLFKPFNYCLFAKILVEVVLFVHSLL